MERRDAPNKTWPTQRLLSEIERAANTVKLAADALARGQAVSADDLQAAGVYIDLAKDALADRLRQPFA